MAFVITEPCISTCDTACVAVCPVDCIHWVEFGNLEDLENSLDRDMFQSLGKLPRMNKH